MKRTGPGRGCTVRQGAILLARELEKRDGCLSVCLCVGVFRITEKRATCADRELHRCRFLLAGVCVSQSGRSARETAPADRHVHTHTQIEKDRMDIYYTGVRVTENYLQALQKQTKLHSSLHLGRVIHTHTCYWYSVVRVVFPLFFNHIVWQRSNKRRVWCM